MLNQYPRRLCARAPLPMGAQSSRNTAHNPAAVAGGTGPTVRACVRSNAHTAPLGSVTTPAPASYADSIALGSPVGAVTLWVLPSNGHSYYPPTLIQFEFAFSSLD